MRLRTRIVIVLVGCVIAAVTVQIAQPHTGAGGAVLLAGGVVLGEIMVLRLDDGTGLPLSYAAILVVGACFEPVAATALIVGAELVAAAIRIAPTSVRSRAAVTLHRLAVAAGALGAYRGAHHLFGGGRHLVAVLGALVLASIGALVVDEIVREASGYRSALAARRGVMAWTALASSGLLMAVGYKGVNGNGALGMWGPLLFSIPLLGTWFSFMRLDSISHTYRQTIEALAMAPELGGFVRIGHAERVSVLAAGIGRELDLPDAEIADLEAAALLHHLGQVTLDDPDDSGRFEAPAEVAAVTAALLRDIGPLRGSADIVAGVALSVRDARRFSGHRSRMSVALASQALKVASAFDDLSEGEAQRSAAALEALYSSPGYVYDSRALEALERLLDRDGLVRRG